MIRSSLGKYCARGVAAVGADWLEPAAGAGFLLGPEARRRSPAAASIARQRSQRPPGSAGRGPRREHIPTRTVRTKRRSVARVRSSCCIEGQRERIRRRVVHGGRLDRPRPPALRGPSTSRDLSLGLTRHRKGREPSRQQPASLRPPRPIALRPIGATAGRPRIDRRDVEADGRATISTAGRIPFRVGQRAMMAPEPWRRAGRPGTFPAPASPPAATSRESMAMLMTGLSGNEIYCLAQKGFDPGNIVVGNSVRSLGLVRGFTSGLKMMSGGEIRQHHRDDRQRPARRDQPAGEGGPATRGIAGSPASSPTCGSSAA